jgi:hypothetical protein
MSLRAAPLAILLGTAPWLSAEDAAQIVRNSVTRDSRNWEIARDYTYLEEREERRSGSTAERSTFEVMMLYGQPYRRLVRRNGLPLPESEERKERQKSEKEAAARKNESPEKRRKRLAGYEKRRAEERRFFSEIPDAYTFTLAGEENVNGRPAWVINARPRQGYTPRMAQARFLKHMQGRLWIDKAEYQFVKADAETLDTISVGLFVARLQKGARIFEQVRVNDEVWLPHRAFVKFAARIALVKRMAGEHEITWSDYRKFRADSTFVPLAEVSLPKP